MGVITEFGYDGSHRTVVSNLPAQGDFSVTDIAVSPVDGMLYFGVGAATNSGVVGLDNFEEDWARDHPDACDLPYTPLELLGYRFDAKNPDASIFSPGIKVTVPFEPFGVSNITHIPAAPMKKPSGAIYRISPDGGDFTVMASGVRNPAGLAVNQYNSVYFTDQGMELRGTRPVNDDPDVLFRLIPQTWYGFPDFSRSLDPISDPKYQPQRWMVDPSGYPSVRPVIDHQASNLRDPNRRLVLGQFKPLSGASKMAVVPTAWPFPGSAYAGTVIVALWGDRAPFATDDVPLKRPLPGYKLVRVDTDNGEVHDFIYNTQGGPASALNLGGEEALERPIDVKFGPDGSLYILDFGKARMKGGHEKISDGTGKIFRLIPIGNPTSATQPTP
jgi:glucose/arabinose dehydrogenase